MKLLGIIVVALTLSNLCYADGYVCESDKGHLHMQMVNDANPYDTEPTAKILFSEPGHPEHVLTTLANVRGMMDNQAATYEADIGATLAKFADSGELIGNTYLEDLVKVIVEVDFSYGKPLVDGEYVPGSVSLTRRDGTTEQYDLDCERYLD
jgi:hypothetical protein